MKRRNFIQCIAALPIVGVVPTVIANTTENKYAKYARFPVDVSTTIYIGEPDPFVKIYTKQGEMVSYGDHSFHQLGNGVHYSKNLYKNGKLYFIEYQYIPIDFNQNQKTKLEMINELNKYNVKWDMFEIIADNGKSNLYAQAIDSKNKEKAWGVYYER